MLFLTYSWKFLRSNTLEQLELKLDKNDRDLDRNKKIFFVTSEEKIVMCVGKKCHKTSI